MNFVFPIIQIKRWIDNCWLSVKSSWHGADDNCSLLGTAGTNGWTSVFLKNFFQVFFFFWRMCVSVLSWFWIEIMNLIRNRNFHNTQPMTDWCIGRYWFTDVTPSPFQSDFTKWILRKDFAIVTLRVTQIPLNPFNSTTIPLQTFPSKVSLKTWMESFAHLQGYSSQRQRPITQLRKMGHFCVISMNRIRWGQWGGRKWAGHDALFFLGSAAAARLERSGLAVEEWNLWDRMGGKRGSDFSLTGGKRGPDWYLGIYEDSLKAART